MGEVSVVPFALMRGIVEFLVFGLFEVISLSNSHVFLRIFRVLGELGIIEQSFTSKNS
jgi:hypothetical protein